MDVVYMRSLHRTHTITHARKHTDVTYYTHTHTCTHTHTHTCTHTPTHTNTWIFTYVYIHILHLRGNLTRISHNFNERCVYALYTYTHTHTHTHAHTNTYTHTHACTYIYTHIRPARQFYEDQSCPRWTLWKYWVCSHIANHEGAVVSPWMLPVSYRYSYMLVYLNIQ